MVQDPAEHSDNRAELRIEHTCSISEVSLEKLCLTLESVSLAPFLSIANIQEYEYAFIKAFTIRSCIFSACASARRV